MKLMPTLILSTLGTTAVARVGQQDGSTNVDLDLEEPRELYDGEFLLTNVMIYLDTRNYPFQRCAVEYLMEHIDDDVYEEFTCAYLDQDLNWFGGCSTSNIDLEDAADMYNGRSYQRNALDSLQATLESSEPQAWSDFIKYWRQEIECTSLLCIFSNRAEGVNEEDLGHAALLLEENGVTTTYGLWPDSHPGIEQSGLANGYWGSDVREGFCGDGGDRWESERYPYIYCVDISANQLVEFHELVSEWWRWRCSNNCASFASEVFYDVTQIDVDADDILGIETPRELGKSIRELNGGNDRSSKLPAQTNRRLVWGAVCAGLALSGTSFTITCM